MKIFHCNCSFDNFFQPLNRCLEYIFMIDLDKFSTKSEDTQTTPSLYIHDQQPIADTIVHDIMNHENNKSKNILLRKLNHRKNMEIHEINDNNDNDSNTINNQKKDYGKLKKYPLESSEKMTKSHFSNQILKDNEVFEDWQIV